MGVKPFNVMEPVKELHDVGLVKLVAPITWDGLMVTVIGVLGPSQVVAVTTWLT